MKKRIDYASVTFGALFIVAVVASTVTAVSWMMDTLGIQLTGFQSVLVGAAIWGLVIGFILWCGMRKAKMKNGN